MLLNCGFGEDSGESLDCKDIKPANLKGNQSWIFIEGLMLKLKLQYFGHLMWRTDSLEKTLMQGKNEGRRRRGWQRVRWLDGITDLMDMTFPSSRSWWCHSTISSSVIPFSSCLQSFPASGSFPMSQFFASDGQSIGVSASASVLPMFIEDWSLRLISLISLQSKDSQESSSTPHFKTIHSSVLSFLYSPTLTSIHDYWKNHNFD